MKLPPALAVLLLFQQVPFSQNLPVPLRSGAKWGLADPSDGREIMPPTLDSVGLFRDSEGRPCPLAVAKKGGQFGLLDRRGKVALPFEKGDFERIHRLERGFWMVARFTFGAANYYEELDSLAKIGDVYRFLHPAAFFDSIGRPVGRAFRFEDEVRLHDGFEEEGFDPNNPSGLRDDFEKNPPETCPVVHLNIDGKLGLFDLQTGRPIAVPAGLEFVPPVEWSERLLVRDSASHLFGYLDRSGKLAIAPVFGTARPFSRSGLALVWRADRHWRIIDRDGRDLLLLGTDPSIFRGPDGALWTQSSPDGLFRKRGATADDLLGNIGIDGRPWKARLGTRDFWFVSRNGQKGLFNMDGSVALPFEFNNFPTLGSGFDGDSMLQKFYFAATKNGRTWLIDSRTMQPLRPKLLPDSGLSMPEDVWQSNFDLIAPLYGDSHFSIKTGERKGDALNIRTGRRWFLQTGPLHLGTDGFGRKLIAADTGSYKSLWFSLDGRPWRDTFFYHRRTPGFGSWGSLFDEKTGTATLVDSSGRTICSPRLPFAVPQFGLDIEANERDAAHPFLVTATSEEGRAAVFSLAGEPLIAPRFSRTLATNPVGRTVRVMVGDTAFGMGLRGSDGRWLIEPGAGRRIDTGAGLGPFAIVFDPDSLLRTGSVIDLRTGQNVPTDYFNYYSQIDGLGFLLEKYVAWQVCASAVLVDGSFKKIRDVPGGWAIEKDAATGCFRVSFGHGGPFLGYMARNGKPLF